LDAYDFLYLKGTRLHIDAIDCRTPSINVVKSFEHFKRGCLTGTIGPENAKYFARVDEKGDAVNGAEGFVFATGKWVGLRKILDFDD